MCGRIVNRMQPGYLREQFDEAAAADILEEPGLLPRFNLAPSGFMPGLRLSNGEELEWAVFRWGLIPRWAKPDRIPDRTFNARSETVAEKPTFRDAYKKRRCILPVSGYYEWTGEKGNKQPFYFHPEDDSPLLLAGIWETWQFEDNHVETCSVLTKPADRHLSDWHHRMPIFFGREKAKEWIQGDRDNATHLVNQVDSSILDVYPVSRAVNNSRNEGSELIDRIADE